MWVGTNEAESGQGRDGLSQHQPALSTFLDAVDVKGSQVYSKNTSPQL
ncbi:MAG: hypothetical protein M3R52_04755 [Acidobacteriota bacterium]|nr:hypothetical protein [Acidobacteriota bacterium]